MSDATDREVVEAVLKGDTARFGTLVDRYSRLVRAVAMGRGVAAADAVRGKRRRYPPSGGELVPLVFEAGGRPAEETVAFVRSWGAGLDERDRSWVIRYAWQQYSLVLQSGNAEMILSATG